MRPFPIEEESKDDLFIDEMEPIWLVPGVLPEPYWDFNMGFCN